jgi:hypothetical protein
MLYFIGKEIFVGIGLFNATFDNISVLLILWGFEYARNVCRLSNKLPSIVYWWRKSELPGDNPKPITKHRQGLLYKAESSGPRQRRQLSHNLIGDKC